MVDHLRHVPPLFENLQDFTVYDLSFPLFNGMPQSPNHPRFTHSLMRRHGDMVRDDGGSAANDLIVTGTHVGTHIDALAHVSQDGQLHGGASAQDAQRGGRFIEAGIHTVDPIMRRGVLLDIPRFLGLQACPPGYEVTSADLEGAAEREGVSVESGDVVLIRSGWGHHFEEADPSQFVGHETGVPGIGIGAAEWLAERKIFAAGADSIAFECLAPARGHSALPVHRILLVQHGIFIIESMFLEEIAEQQVYAFGFIAIPLRLIGATGSPIRPIALSWNSSA